MSLEVTKICRACLALEGAFLSIYDSKGPTDGGGCVADMLGELTSTLPNKLDGMPDKVCLSCISEINRCYTFKKKCEHTDRTLRQLLDINEETQESVEAENEEEKKVKVESVPENKSPDERKKPQKRKADPGVKIVSEEIVQEPFVESNAIYELQNEEDIETAFYVIDSVEEENIVHEGKLEEAEGENVDYEKMSQEDDAEIIISTEYKPEVKRAAAPLKQELQCRLCPMNFVLPRNLAKHMKKHHNINEQPMQQAVSDHEMDHETTVQAEDQHITFEVIEEMEETTPTKEPTKDLKEIVEAAPQEQTCPHCGAGFAQRKSLAYHIKHAKCVERQYTCEQCQKVFISTQKLRAHMRTHLEQFACDMCDQAYPLASELSKHKVEKHNVKYKHQCSECKKVFTMMSTLKDHMRTHSGEKPFLCSLCGKGFSQNANLRQHIMRHNRTKPFECKICMQTFVSKGELFSHVRTHTGDHPFACNICKASFTTSSSLVKHTRTHTGERPYACEYCPMRFTALNTLKNHRRTHTGERPFKCKFCQRGFAQKSDCSMHERTHTGDRRYSCHVCGSAFQQSGTLRTHMKTHTKTEAAEAAGREVEQDEQPQRTICLSEEEDVEQHHEPMQVAKNDNNSLEDGAEADLAEEDLLNFAIEDCSSESHEFIGE